MKYVEGIKRVLAIVILACFFLPLSQCTTLVSEDGKPDAKMVSKTEEFVPYKSIRFQDYGEVLTVAIFVWPLGFLLLMRRARTKRGAVLISIAELLCGLASLVYLAYLLLFWRELMWGGAVAIFAYVASVLISIRLIVFHALQKS